MSGVELLKVWKSSMSSSNPASLAIAKKCSTPLVEPPVVAIERMALSRAGRVMICEGVRF